MKTTNDVKGCLSLFFPTRTTLHHKTPETPNTNNTFQHCTVWAQVILHCTDHGGIKYESVEERLIEHVRTLQLLREDLTGGCSQGPSIVENCCGSGLVICCIVSRPTRKRGKGREGERKRERKKKRESEREKIESERERD